MGCCFNFVDSLTQRLRLSPQSPKLAAVGTPQELQSHSRYFLHHLSSRHKLTAFFLFKTYLLINIKSSKLVWSKHVVAVQINKLSTTHHSFQLNASQIICSETKCIYKSILPSRAPSEQCCALEPTAEPLNRQHSTAGDSNGYLHLLLDQFSE